MNGRTVVTPRRCNRSKFEKKLERLVEHRSGARKAEGWIESDVAFNRGDERSSRNTPTLCKTLRLLMPWTRSAASRPND